MSSRGHCAEDLGGTENLVKPRKSLGKKPGQTPSYEGIVGRSHSLAGGEHVFKVIYTDTNNRNKNSSDSSPSYGTS